MTLLCHTDIITLTDIVYLSWKRGSFDYNQDAQECTAEKMPSSNNGEMMFPQQWMSSGSLSTDVVQS
jgi:hypothetical protein